MSTMSKTEARDFLNQVLIGTPEDGSYSKFFYNRCLMNIDRRGNYSYGNPFLGMFSKIEEVFMAEGEKQVWKYKNDSSYVWHNAHKDYDWGYQTYTFMMNKGLDKKFWTEKQRVMKESSNISWRKNMGYIINYSFYIDKNKWDEFMEEVLLPVFLEIFIPV